MRFNPSQNTLSYSLTHFMPLVSSIPPENVKKPKAFPGYGKDSVV